MQSIKQDAQTIRSYASKALDIINSMPVSTKEVDDDLLEVKKCLESIVTWCGIIERNVMQLSETIMNIIIRLDRAVKD